MTKEVAGEILSKWRGKPTSCLSISRLKGGMIHSVLKLEFDEEPNFAVVKINNGETNPFDAESLALRHLRDVSKFPSPQVYLCAEKGSVIDKHFLLIELLSGVNLGDASMSLPDKERLDEEIADILLELHSHTADRFGKIGEQKYERWLDYFRPVLLKNLSESQQKISDSLYNSCFFAIDDMDRHFESQSAPTLVHGDIWVTNVMVIPDEEGWRISGFVDPSSIYADVEFELAYLEVFRCVTPAFFKRYTQVSPLRDGYPVRRLYYWLNTMLRHVVLFGDQHYIDRTSSIVKQLALLTS